MQATAEAAHLAKGVGWEPGVLAGAAAPLLSSCSASSDCCVAEAACRRAMWASMYLPGGTELAQCREGHKQPVP